MVDTRDLKSLGLLARAGSSPASGTLRVAFLGVFERYIAQTRSRIERSEGVRLVQYCSNCVPNTPITDNCEGAMAPFMKRNRWVAPIFRLRCFQHPISTDTPSHSRSPSAAGRRHRRGPVSRPIADVRPFLEGDRDGAVDAPQVVSSLREVCRSDFLTPIALFRLIHGRL